MSDCSQTQMLVSAPVIEEREVVGELLYRVGTSSWSLEVEESRARPRAELACETFYGRVYLKPEPGMGKQPGLPNL